MHVQCRCESWSLAQPFVIARETIDTVPLVYLEIEARGHFGRAEAVGVDYRGEHPATLKAEILDYLGKFETPPTRDHVLSDLPPGGARNAIDCALWDLEAKSSGARVWEFAGIDAPVAVNTAFTLSLGAPDAMAVAAAGVSGDALLKLKLGGAVDEDIDRVRNVRRAAPGARLIVDINEGWGIEELNRAAPALSDAGVEFIEQPLPRASQAALKDYVGGPPLCADESIDDLLTEEIVSLYDVINIKLDKTGGLTRALQLASEARTAGLKIIVGSMLGTSLGMAPAFVLAPLCLAIDLDGPLLLKRDRDPSICFDGLTMHVFGPDVWG